MNKIDSLKMITIKDDISFNRIVDVLNECFGKNYKAWMQSGCILNDEKTIRAWFPKMAVIYQGKARAQSRTKAWINTLSEDGMIIRAFSDKESVTEFVDEPIITFAKFPDKPYKYIGTFIIDRSVSKPNDIIYKRIATEVDLSPWR